MDAKRHRDDETTDVALVPYLGMPFDELPAPALAKIILDSGLSVAQLHLLCTLSKRFRRLCGLADVWKRVFITRFVEQPRDPRDAADFSQWVDEPLVKRWDRVAAEHSEIYGFTHLVAEHISIIHAAAIMPIRRLYNEHFSLWFGNHDPDLERGVGIPRVSIESTFNMDLIEFQTSIGPLLTPCGMSLSWNTEIWRRDDGRIQARMWINAAERTCLIANLLEHGWIPPVELRIQSCVRCDATATLVCVGCDKFYCGTVCARIEENLKHT